MYFLCQDQDHTFWKESPRNANLNQRNLYHPLHMTLRNMSNHHGKKADQDNNGLAYGRVQTSQEESLPGKGRRVHQKKYPKQPAGTQEQRKTTCRGQVRTYQGRKHFHHQDQHQRHPAKNHNGTLGTLQCHLHHDSGHRR
jgi:hypothetical protein